jgi:aminopeptidase
MYKPEPNILKNYADVLIKFALWSGKGVKKGDVVALSISESARDFLPYLQRAILESGAHMLLNYAPDGLSRQFFELATDAQLTWVPRKYLLERVRVCDHFVGIISEHDKHELEGIDGKKIMARSHAMKFFMDARRDKENKGKLTWTLGLYGTPAMAHEVNMTLEEYWDQIIKACYLDEKDPIATWRKVFDDLEKIKSRLNKLPIDKLHIESEDADLWVNIGPHRQWLGGSGRNIPSFELFISPDWRGTHGWMRFNKPLYRYGVLIEDIYLQFENGRVTNATARKNQEVLRDMIAVENADKIGEFSLTDKRFSRITKFMGETLYDENVGGEYGNVHIALGAAYRDSFTGDPKTVNEEGWIEMGYNDSSVHTDIVSTTNRTVTAIMQDGSKKIIYKDGEFHV